jgi:hypothetical protein
MTQDRHVSTLSHHLRYFSNDHDYIHGFELVQIGLFRIGFDVTTTLFPILRRKCFSFTWFVKRYMLGDGQGHKSSRVDGDVGRLHSM